MVTTYQLPYLHNIRSINLQLISIFFIFQKPDFTYTISLQIESSNHQQLKTSANNTTNSSQSINSTPKSNQIQLQINYFITIQLQNSTNTSQFPQMLLQQPSPLPKTLTKPSFPHSHFPKHLRPQFPYIIHRTSFLLRASSTSSDTTTLPQSAIRRIADKLRSLGYVEETNDKKLPPNETLGHSPGEIFVPLPERIPKHRVGHTLDPSWSTPENPVPKPGSGTAMRRYNELRKEVWREKVRRRSEGNVESDKVPTMAELKLAPEELRRLRSVGIAVKTRLKIGKAGITEGIVNGIHERWRRTEVVKIVCEDLCRLNMKRTHDLLEVRRVICVVFSSISLLLFINSFKHTSMKEIIHCYIIVVMALRSWRSCV